MMAQPELQRQYALSFKHKKLILTSEVSEFPGNMLQFKLDLCPGWESVPDYMINMWFRRILYFVESRYTYILIRVPQQKKLISLVKYPPPKSWQLQWIQAPFKPKIYEP